MIILIILPRNWEVTTIEISRKAAVTYVSWERRFGHLCLTMFLSLLKHDIGLLLFHVGLMLVVSM